jgi:hypothetical protein
MASTAEEYRKKWGLNEDGTPIAAAAPSAQQSVYGPKYRDPELEAYRQKWGDQYAIPQPPEPERDYDTGIGYAFMRGLERLRAMPDVAQGDYEELAQHYGNMENWRMSDEDIAKFEEMRNTEGWWAKAGQLFQNPRLVMQVVAESLPMMAAPIAGAIAGGFAGGALTGGNPLGAAGGAMAGGGVGSFYTEYFNAVGEYLSDKAGVDLRNPQQLKAAFEDETLMQGAREWARKRGIPIAVFDALSMGLAGRIAKPVSGVVGKVTGGRRIGAGTAAEITSQAGFGAAGEAGAQLYSEGEIKDELDVLLEGFAEIVPGFAEAAVSRYTDRRAEARRDRKPSDESPIDSLNQPPDETPPPLYGGEADTSDAAMEAAGDRLYEDLGEEGPNTPQRDELDILLEDLGKQLEQDLATRAAKDEYEATAQARRNTEMIALEEERAIRPSRNGKCGPTRKSPTRWLKLPIWKAARCRVRLEYQQPCQTNRIRNWSRLAAPRSKASRSM